MKVRFALIAFFLMLQMAAAAARGQEFAIAGVVQDQTGGAIVGAGLKVEKPGTEIVVASQTDDQGAFRVAVPGAGRYGLIVEASGFLTLAEDVDVSAAAPVVNVTAALAVKGNSLTVEVTADALAAETTSTQLGENLDAQKIEGVPLNGRSFTDLMAVQPGIVPQNLLVAADELIE